MNGADLIDNARRNADFPQPTEADLKRAISAAYYAMFTALAGSCADTLVGQSPNARSAREWVLTFRALQHGYARQQFERREVNLYSPAIVSFARTFTTTQAMRHEADYNPVSQFTQRQANDIIDQAEYAIDQFMAASQDERRLFAAYVLMRNRL